MVAPGLQLSRDPEKNISLTFTLPEMTGVGLGL